MSVKIEKRTFNGDLRAESQGREFILSGYAALFNSPSKNLGGFTEEISPTAFTRSLTSKAPVAFTFNHSQDAILARTDNFSLYLETDARGLKFRAQLNPKIQSHQDIWEACRSGLYKECSFAFTVPPNGDSWSADGSRRVLLDVDLIDCALVGTPAYDGTSADARSADTAGDAARRARFAEMQADWERREKAAAIAARIATESQAQTRGNQDWFAARCEEACRAKGLAYCDHDNDFVYAADPDDGDEQNCLRFEYDVDDEGRPVLDENSRTRVKHSLTHSERGRKILADRQLRRQMAVAAGRYHA
jgi:hypothetical protein